MKNNNIEKLYNEIYEIQNMKNVIFLRRNIQKFLEEQSTGLEPKEKMVLK